MIVERYKKERELPILDKVKFLVPQEFTVSNFCVVVRSKLVIRPSQSLHFIVGNKAGMFTHKPTHSTYAKTRSTYVFSPINGYGSGWVIQSLQRRRWISLYHLCFNRDVWLTKRIATNHYELLQATTGSSSYWYCTFLLTNLKIYFTKLKISFFYCIITVHGGHFKL